MTQRWLSNDPLTALAGGYDWDTDRQSFWDFEAFERMRDVLEEFGVGVIAGLLLGLCFHDELYFLI